MPETGGPTTGPNGTDENGAGWYIGDDRQDPAGAPDEAYEEGFEDDIDDQGDTGMPMGGPVPSGPADPGPAPTGPRPPDMSESMVASQQEGISGDIMSSPTWKGKDKQLQPSNAHEWVANTNSKLNLAKALIRDAQFQTGKNELANLNCTRRHEDKTHAVDFQIKNKLMTTSDLSKTIEDRINSTEDTIRQLGSCLFGLQRAYRSKWSQLNVCERRLELRNGRPLQELVRDNLQAALENERQVLVEARQMLNDQIVGTKQMLTLLEAMKGELIEDLQHKRHAQRIDHRCLQPDKPVKKGADRIFLPSLPEISNYTLPPAPKDQPRGTGDQNEGNRCDDTMTRISRAVRLEENVMGTIAENDAVVRHCNAECKNANAAVCACMDKSNHQTEHLKDQLVEQMRQVDATIAEAERSLIRTKKKLESHNQPLRCLNQQFALRDRRTDREHIRDGVTDNMENHLDSVKKSVKELTTKWQGTKNILDHLKASKAQMAEDLKYKNIALKIDDQCRKVTPKKAIEHDSLDPCSGRVHPDGKKNAAGRLQAVVDREFG
eukprot:gnl/MRDRNA2_/MRDRNA2_94780_c0_seq1.p1 gnl/MRDRNA2_/MRDRNA2_94780_c0~~gnl/MRDRNA2_/MRDRNA2_94780_c0_seq1.p1  ORF type:complete len:549 (+),score=116.06 gnl/MRDRNA2_/MRDRNA2_94780_c0_seq1:89-1735(+)